jgi:hypothetical protein
MKAVFVETTEFTEWVSDYLPDEVYAKLQQELMDDPNKGTPIPGCGGLRKIRVSDPKRGKGKRGGARVIYLYVAEAKWFYLIDIYDKSEKADLSAAEKKVLSRLAAELKKHTKTVISRRSRKKK